MHIKFEQEACQLLVSNQVIFCGLGSEMQTSFCKGNKEMEFPSCSPITTDNVFFLCLERFAVWLSCS